MKLFAAALPALLGCAAASAAAVTPVEKVLTLLRKLESKLEQEGKDEAAAYDKYACFCKEQASEKLYAIERSTAKLEKLDAKIGKLEGDISALDGDITELGKTITGLADDISKAQDTRDSEHSAFLTSLADVSGAVDSCKLAVKALKESKSAMEGKTDLDAASLAQIKAVATTALAVGSHTAFSDRELSQLSSLVDASQPGQADQYTYHANDIITTIEELHAKFQKNKDELEKSEFDTKAAFDKRQLSMESDKKFAEKEKKEKAALAEEKREEKGALESERSQESDDKTSDDNFLKVLTGDCEKKAKAWDARSKARVEEITAISQAEEALLKGNAEEKYKANKKLVFSQTSAQGFRAAAPKTHWQWVEDAPAAPSSSDGAPARAASFLQLKKGSSLRGTALEGAQALAMRRAYDLLQSSAKGLKSSTLSFVALKVSLSEDHFVKVRGIIKDLIARLQSEASAEKSKKSYCDTNMKKAVTKRDSEQSKIEDAKAQISSKEAKEGQLKDEIAAISNEVAELKKALMEATELRQEESAENAKTLKEAGEGKIAVSNALQVLKSYYDKGTSMLQQRSSYVPPNADSDGNTVGDLAPDVEIGEYESDSQTSSSIVSLLEVIVSDFEGTISKVSEDEKTAAADYNAFKKGNEDSVTEKEKSIKTKDGLIADLKSDVVTLREGLGDAQKLHESALKELDVLHKECVAGEETNDERVGSREKEIKALKEAHDILENFDK